MSRWKVIVDQRRLRRDTVKDVATQAFPNANVSVEKDVQPRTRSERFDVAMSAIEEASNEIESLRDELQEWRDNLPDNLQDGDKAQALDEAISELEGVCSSLEECNGTNVEFPGMF